MDNLTHSLVGLVAAKAGLERVSPYATAVCVLAANGPDADIIATLGGQWFYLKHHRGITHSIVGTLVLAVLIPFSFWAIEWLIAWTRGRTARARVGGLLMASLLLSVSHPLLDWTNNYGWRPWLPWDQSWVYGDLVFIIDPWLWLSLGGAAFLLTATKNWRVAMWALLALVVTAAIFILPRRAGMPYPFVSQALWAAGVAGLIVAWWRNVGERFGSSLAIIALALIVVYWGGLALLHARALTYARGQAEAAEIRNGEKLLRVAAMPSLADPVNWRAAAETDRAFYRFNSSAISSAKTVDGWLRAERFIKPQGANAALVARAAEDWRAQVFLDFARFPATRVQTDCARQALVQFADLRFTQPSPARNDGGSFRLEVVVP